MALTSRLLKYLFITAVFLLLFIVCSPIIYAQSSSAIAQSFKVSGNQDDFVAGALASTIDKENAVNLATLGNANQLIGVIDGNPLVSLTENGQGVNVVIGGTTNVLVSDINGVIKSGDKITASPIAGVGMKATADSQIVGTAQDNFTETVSKSIADRSGKHHDVRLGYVRAQIGVAAYHASGTGSSFLPPFIQNIADSIAGQPVSLLRVLICSALLVLGFITVVVLVYTSTRSAMTSLGRNPLAAHAIRRGLYQISLVSLLIVGGTLVASYLILTV